MEWRKLTSLTDEAELREQWRAVARAPLDGDASEFQVPLRAVFELQRFAALHLSGNAPVDERMIYPAFIEWLVTQRIEPFVGIVQCFQAMIYALHDPEWEPVTVINETPIHSEEWALRLPAHISSAEDILDQWDQSSEGELITVFGAEDRRMTDSESLKLAQDRLIKSAEDILDDETERSSDLSQDKSQK